MKNEIGKFQPAPGVKILPDGPVRIYEDLEGKRLKEIFDKLSDELPEPPKSCPNCVWPETCLKDGCLLHDGALISPGS
jgi:hypothetical protein